MLGISPKPKSALHVGPLEVNLHAIPLTIMRTTPTPIMRRANVKCSLPVGLAAPRKVPMTVQTRPINEIDKINHLMDNPEQAKQDFVVLVSASLSREQPERR